MTLSDQTIALVFGTLALAATVIALLDWWGTRRQERQELRRKLMGR